MVPQTAYIHPRITGDMVRYFEWMGAAVYTADRRAGAMHGKQFLLDAVHAGIDELSSTGGSTSPRIKFRQRISNWWSISSPGLTEDAAAATRALRLDVTVEAGRIRSWKLSVPDDRPASCRF